MTISKNYGTALKKDHYRKLYIGFDVSSKKIEVYARTADEDKGVSMQIENSKNLSLNNSKFSINYNRCGKV